MLGERLMLSKFRKVTDKVRRSRGIIISSSSLLSSLCCRSHSAMVEQKQSSSTSKVQALYDLCKKTFSPSTPSPPPPQASHKLSSLLDTLTAADVGLKEEDPDDDRGHGFFGFQQLRAARWAKPLTYIDVFDGANFTICIFCFPSSSVIPLHDHPGMSVFSKVLYGSLHVKAYDWVDPPRVLESKGPDHPPVRLAKLVVDKVLTAPCGTSVLYPRSGGNLHCFTAVTPCAVLDVLAPPYREDAGRRCTYYHDYPYSASAKGSEIIDGKVEDYAWLAEIDTPDDLYMRSGVYRGPAIHV